MKRLALILALTALPCVTPVYAHEHAPVSPDRMWANMLTKQQSLAISVATDGKGRLWRVGVKDGQVRVDHSDDSGRSYSAPVAVNPEAEIIGADGDSRPRIAIGRHGIVLISWTRLLDKPFSGDVRYARSLDGGKTFSAPLTVNDNREVIGHRFDALSVNADGRVYLAWLDKRDLSAAKARGERYAGSAVYYAVSDDDGASFSANVKLVDHSCDCCRIALAAPARGAPVAFWRHDFDGDIRDHALAQLDGKQAPRRVTHDEWQIAACPHHGPALSIAADGLYHLAWFDNAPKARGLFYARSGDEGRTLSAPLHFGDDAHQAGHPDVLSLGRSVWLVWKEFDGEQASVRMMHSTDSGATWTPPQHAATTRDASDHPQLVSLAGRVWLSWNSKLEGHRLIPLEGQP